MTVLRVLIGRALRTISVRLTITGIILAYLARDMDMRQAMRAVVDVDGRHLLLVLGLVAADRVVMIVRWFLLLRAADVPVSFAAASRIFLVSSFVGSFLPAGIGSDAARAWAIAAQAARGSEAVASVAIDRVLGVLALVGIGVIGASLWTPEMQAGWPAVVGVLALTMAGLALFWADVVVQACLPRAWREAPLGQRAIRLSTALSRYRGRRGVLLVVMGWSVAVQLLRILQAYLLGQGLGIDVAFGYYLVFMPIGLLMLLLPISVSGFGLPQGVIVWLLRPVGVADERAFALSTLIVLTGLAGNLPGLLLWVTGRPPEVVSPPSPSSTLSNPAKGSKI